MNDSMGVRQEFAASRRLLVVSENQELSLFLKGAIEAHVESALDVQFCYTSENKHPQQMIEIGAEEINVKAASTVAWILDRFDLVFSLHCKQVFPRSLVEGVRCINFHPGLNPFNRGWFPQAFSIVNGFPVGATVHHMDAEIDHGAIIAQREVPVLLSDTSLQVYGKVIAAEKQLIEETVGQIIKGHYSVTYPSGEGNYNSIQDYRKMCELDLAAIGTLGEHLNLLRATTHGDFRNAYFLDEQGRKCYVKIVFEEASSN